MDIMMVGDKMVPVDDDLRAVKHTSDALVQAADADGTSVTAVISKGKHSLASINAAPVQVIADVAHITSNISHQLNKTNTELLDIVAEVLERSDDSEKE